MTVTLTDIRRGAYYDSVLLMQLQLALAALDGVQEAGVVMGAAVNKELLAQGGLLTPEVEQAQPDDLVIVVQAKDRAAAQAALAQVDGLLARRRPTLDHAYRPRSLATAARMLPAARWVLVSVAGRHAAGVARDALRLGKHVFLFSDNVPLSDEISLKQTAGEKGLLVMGPDCGTAFIGGIGLGFANKVRRGPIGIVAAAGTGLQQVAARIHQLGSGLTHGIGVGGRDLTAEVGGRVSLQGISLLSRDAETQVMVMISKPPAAAIAEKVLAAARQAPQPVVVCFVGQAAAPWRQDNLYFAQGLDDAARLAVELTSRPGPISPPTPPPSGEESLTPPSLPGKGGGGLGFAPGQRYLRGLFSGGTLAYEAQYLLRDYLPRVWANAPLNKADRIPNSLVSQEHTIIDLGEDEFTVGRLHPMMDNQLRIRRLLQEADDPETAVILLDVVLGYGAHPNPAGELGPAIAKAKTAAEVAGRRLEVVAVVVGTDEDPQNLEGQIRQLRRAGAWVDTSNEAVVRHAGRLLDELHERSGHQFTTLEPRPRRLLSTSSRFTNSQATSSQPSLLREPFAAINVGLESFAENLIAQGAPAIQVDWRPPARGNEELMLLEEPLTGKTIDIERANKTAVERMMESRPVLVGLGRARDVIPGMREDMLLHAGPPVAWERMCGPQRGAVVGALIFEGKAANWAAAEALIAAGQVAFEPCHHHRAVGPMAGVISPSMWVYIIEDKTHGQRAYSNLNEGYGKVLRMGAYGPDVIARLRWLNETAGPILAAAAAASDGVDMRALIAEALHMGDEGHNRNKAASLLFLKVLSPQIIAACAATTAAEIVRFMGDTPLTVLNPIMAACKVMADAGHGIEGSTLVTAMARNGTDFGIRVSGLGDRWFTAPAGRVKALYFPGFTERDANPDIGDSTITETAGIGGFAMATAPAIVTFVGGQAKDAVNATLDMYEITCAEHRFFTMPALDFRGAPTGIDIRKVVEKGIPPRVNTGVAHKDPGIGQVGAGVVSAPLSVFEDALAAYAEKYGISR